jgi:hypothetical protein
MGLSCWSPSGPWLSSVALDLLRPLRGDQQTKCSPNSSWTPLQPVASVTPKGAAEPRIRKG